jgi:class 3 adenylate cyclase
MADLPPPDVRAWLELSDGRRQSLTGQCTIGRADSKTIVLSDGHVSSLHAVIEPAGDAAWRITDSSSTNGTFLNGRRLTAPAFLRHGATIRIGPYKLLFCQPGRDGALASDQAGGSTMVQAFHGPCWLLLLDLVNFTARRQQLGAVQTHALQSAWASEVRTVVEAHQGTLNSQPGDALLIYWPAGESGPAGSVVLDAVAAVRKLQARATALPFRLVLHHGVVHVTAAGALRAEQLAGPEVDFLFRIEKLAKPLGTHALVSDAAALALEITQRTRDLGEHPVPSFVGRFRLHALD